MSLTVTLRDLNFILSGESQTEKGKYDMVSLICGI